MQTRKAYLYVFHTMSDWEYGYLIAELNTGRYFKKDLAPLKVVTVGVNYGYLNSRKHTSNSLDYMKMICSNYKGENLHEMGAVISDENLITASGVAPLEFATEVLKKLDVFMPDTLHSWYNLNKTHQPEYFFQLMNSLNR